MTQATMEAPPAVPARSNGAGSDMVVRTMPSVFTPMAARFGTDVNRLRAVLKATVIKGTGGREVSEEEMAAFAIVANQYNLNPFTREIHAFADRGRIVPIVGIDGWAHIVNAHPQFDGCEFVEVESPNGEPLKTTCRMYVKGRAKPVEVTERYSECKRNTEPWKGMPFRMLRHKAFMQAARLAFSISGLYDDDEASDVLRNAGAVEITDPPKARTQALLDKLTQRPVSEGQTAEADPEELERLAREMEQEQATRPAASTPPPQPQSTAPEPDVGPVNDDDVEAPAIDTLDEALEQWDWDHFKKALRPKLPAQPVVTKSEFEGGLFKWAVERGGKPEAVPKDQWKQLWQAVVAGRFEWKTGKVTEQGKA